MMGPMQRLRWPGKTALMLAVVGAGTAVTPPEGALAAQGRERLENIFHDVEEVHVVNLDVRVTDADGKPVTGLTVEDFEVLEAGVPVPLTNFYAVENGEPVASLMEAEAETVSGPSTPPVPPAAPTEAELHLVIFVDNANLAPANRARTLQHLRRHLEEQWRPGLEVMVVSNDRSLKIRQAPTGRRDEVEKALEELDVAGSRSARLDRDLDNLLRAMERVNVDAGIPSMAVKGGGEFTIGPGGGGGFGGADDFDDERSGPTQEELTAQVAAEAIALVPQITAYAQLRTDEIRGNLRIIEQLIATVAGLPGRKAVLYVSDGLSANPAEAVFEAFDQRFAPLGPIPAVISMRSESVRFDLTPHFQKLVAFANSSRVSFYTLDASPPASIGRGGADRQSNFVTNEFASTEERNEQESLRWMAESTGGLTSLAGSTLDQVLETFFRDFDNYYSLGFVAERHEGERNVEVRLRGGRRALEVRHRAALREKSTDERMVERTLSALLLESLDNPLGVGLETEAFQPAGEGAFLVPVIVRIPLGKLVLVPGAQEHQAQVSMYIAVQDEEGRTSEVIKQKCPIRIPNSELLVALGRQAGCGVRLRMHPGEQRVAIGVQDEISSLASCVQLQIDVGEPAPTPGVPEASESR